MVIEFSAPGDSPGAEDYTIRYGYTSLQELVDLSIVSIDINLTVAPSSQSSVGMMNDIVNIRRDIHVIKSLSKTDI